MLVSSRTVRRKRARAGFVAALAAGLAGPALCAAEFAAYESWKIASGDAHQHAAGFELPAEIAAGNEAVLHEHGWPFAVWPRMAAAGYRWGSLSTHDFSMGSGADAKGALWWRDPGSTAVADPWTGSSITPGPGGFPLTDPNDPWNEATSRSRAALAATKGGFSAFAGREFTTIYSVFTGSCPGCPSGGCALCGGHKTALPLLEARSICSALPGMVEPRDRCASEGDLYAWIGSLGGVLIQAHPEGGPPGPLFDPITAPGGFSDAHVQGMEVGSEWFSPTFYQSYLRTLEAGYRVFPAFGSDDHNPSAITPERGGTICWVQTFSRSSVIAAMKARRCYYARTAKPVLRFEASATPTGAAAVMGAVLALPERSGSVRAHAKNDPLAQSLDPPQRFDRIELVNAQGAVLRACSLGDPDPDCTCVSRADGDECWLRADGVPLLGPGEPQQAVHVRVCRAGDCATDLHSRVLAVSAPVFLDWVNCDVDGDRIACDQDRCPSAYDPAQLDSDGDGRGDACDLCPWVLDSQADRDGDGVGDACDRCPEVPDPAQADADGDGMGNACDVCPILADHREDADGDGTPDRCDNCAISNPDQLDSDGDRAGDNCDPDDDQDGILDGSDNCPYARNTLQRDRGRLGGPGADGIGDSCQCGDMNADGAVDSSDAVALLLAVGLGQSALPEEANALCDVDGDGICALPDVSLLFEQLAAPPSSPPQRCAAALPRPAPDGDGDGLPDWLDNCRSVANPWQRDRGGFMSVADGVGDACQCGDVTGSGSVNSADALAIERTSLGLAPCTAGLVTQTCSSGGATSWFLLGRCDVTGDSVCSGSDALRIKGAALGLAPPLAASCAGEPLPGD